MFFPFKNFIRRLINQVLLKMYPHLNNLDFIINKIDDFNEFHASYNRDRKLFSNSQASKQTMFYEPYQICDSTISAYTYIASYSKISQTSIGKFCSIGPHFLCGWGIHPTNGISTAPMFYSTLMQNGISLSENDKIEERKAIHIGNDVFIGANVTVLDGVTIGDGAVIGAGAVVSKDIPPYAIAVGNPIQIIRYRFNQEQIEALVKICWWNFSPEELQDVEKMFFDIDLFIMKYIN